MIVNQWEQKTYGMHEHLRDVGLWRGVLCQAIQDMASNSRKSEAQKARRDAEAWYRSRDFEEVCCNADLDPGYVRSKIEEARLRGFLWRLPAGLGWRAKLKARATGQSLAPLHTDLDSNN